MGETIKTPRPRTRDLSEIEITHGRGLCSMMKCGTEASHLLRVNHTRDEAQSYLWACPEHLPQVEQFARNIVNGPGLEFFVQMAPRSFRLVVRDSSR